MHTDALLQPGMVTSLTTCLHCLLPAYWDCNQLFVAKSLCQLMQPTTGL